MMTFRAVDSKVKFAGNILQKYIFPAEAHQLVVLYRRPSSDNVDRFIL